MTNKQAGRITGILFIAATAAGVASLPFVGVLDKADYVQQINQNPNSLLIGSLLIALMGIFCAAIALSIYPVLSKHSKGLAIGAAGFRVAEGTIFIVSAGLMAALVPAAAAGQSTADILKIAQNGISDVGGFAFSTGALLYYIGFYKTKLVPRWLSIWGLIAIVMHFAAIVSIFFGADTFSPLNTALNMPIAFQEIVLAVYLIIFGFNDKKEKNN